jgi:hypothetical protein
MGNSDGIQITLQGNLSDFVAFFQRIGEYLPQQATEIKFILDGKEITMLEMTDADQCDVALVIKDKNGKPANVDDPPVWSTSDDLVAMADSSADPTSMKAKIVAKGSGVCQITVTADADLGAGVKPLIGFLDVTILGTATVIELVPGPITPQP